MAILLFFRQRIAADEPSSVIDSAMLKETMEYSILQTSARRYRPHGPCLIDGLRSFHCCITAATLVLSSRYANESFIGAGLSWYVDLRRRLQERRLGGHFLPGLGFLPSKLPKDR